MKRIHLFEFHDLDWFPPAWRVLLTDQLDFFARTFNPYGAIVPKLKQVLEKLGCRDLVDLCAGGGGPVLQIQEQLVRQQNYAVRVTLTDKFPNVAAFRRAGGGSDGRVVGVENSVDATDVPAELQGFRTLFTSFHHFAPEAAKRILQDAVDKQEGIGIFEYTEKSLIWLLVLPFMPIYAWLVTPFLRPFRWQRLLWTILVPVVPLVMAWDGLVSCLRTYSPEELRELTADIHCRQPDGVAYTWEIGKIRSFGAARVTYVLGYPT